MPTYERLCSSKKNLYTISVLLSIQLKSYAVLTKASHNRVECSDFVLTLQRLLEELFGHMRLFVNVRFRLSHV